MYSKQVMQAQLRGLGSAAVTGILVSMLATTQMFAQSATIAPAQSGTTTTSATTLVPQNRQMSTEGEASSNSNIASLDLPAAPTPVAEANPGPDPLGQEAGRRLTSDTNNHKVKRPGQLAVAIAGCALMGFGGYIYALNGNGEARAVLGSIFFAPGAVMAGLGFHFAFKPKN